MSTPRYLPFLSVVMLAGSAAWSARPERQAGPVAIENVAVLIDDAKGFRPLLWSPDGQAIALGDDRQGIRSVDVQSGMIWDVYRGGQEARTRVAWSEDSRLLYYLVMDKDGPSVRQFDLGTGASGNFRILDEGLLLDVWRGIENPRERVVILERLGDIVAASDEGERSLIQWGGGCLASELSPSGNRVVFNYTPGGETDPEKREAKGGAPDRFGLYLFDLESGEATFLAEGAGEPTWHPGSEWVFCEMTQGDGQSVLASELYAISVETGEIRQLTETEDRIETRCKLSRDGDRIAFHDEKTGSVCVADIAYE